MKRFLTTRLYNLSHEKKNCRQLHLVTTSNKLPGKVFFIWCCTEKGNAKAIQVAINCIVPHAFGDHKNCDNKWCKFKQDPGSYKHHDLPYGIGKTCLETN